MNSEAGRNAVSRNLILVFLLFAIGIGGAGYLYYEAQTRTIKKEKQADLSAIADLKAKGILDWRTQWAADAGVIFKNPIVARRVRWFLETPNTPSQLKKELVDWMVSMQAHYEYASIFLLDRKGEVRLAVNAKREQISRGVQTLATDAMRAKKVVFSDLRRDEVTDSIDLDIFVPLLVHQEGGTLCIGAYVLRIDPYHFLYPLIHSWPTPSRTSEALLIRREDDEVLFLNELRHVKNSALTLRLPLSKEQLPAALAVQGKEGIVEGIDYRGVPVLAALRGIPDSPWFLVAKVDLDEVYSPIREQAYIVIVLVIILTALTGGIVVVLLREQRLRYYRNQYKAELERSALVQHYGYLTKYANDIILLTDEAGRVVEANDRAVEAYGYTREELIGRDSRTLLLPVQVPSVETQMEKIKERNGMVYESLHQRKDGSVFPVEASSRLIEVEGRKFFQSIMRDITERKRIEERYRTIIRTALDGFWLLDMQGRFLDVNDAYCNLIGYSREELLTMGIPDVEAVEKPGETAARIRNIMKVGGDRFETHHKCKDGRAVDIEVSVNYMRDEERMSVFLRDITERKRAEETLRESEERLREAQALGRIGNWEFDIDNQKITWSDQVYRLYERDPALAPPTVEEEAAYYAPEQVERLHEYARRAIEEGKEFRYDLQAHLPSGTLAHFSATMRPVKDESGRVIRLFGTVQDITERRQVEEALRASEENARFLADVVENASLPFAVGYPDGHLGVVNKAFCELTGYTDEELINMNWGADLTPPEWRELDARVFAQLDLTGEPQRYEKEYIRKDGTRVPVEFLVQRVCDDAGKLHHYRAFVTDITERKQAEAALERERGLLRALIENIPNEISVKDTRGRIILANAATLAAFGAAREEELIGKTDFDLVKPHLAEQHQAEERAILDTGIPLVNDEATRFSCTTGETEKCILRTKVPLEDSHGERIGVLCVNQNITERKRAEEALRYERNLLRTLIDNLPDAIYVKDSSCRKTIANLADVHNMGLQSEAEALGKDDFDLFPKDMAERFFADDQSVLQTGQPVLNREEYVLDAEGQKRWLFTSKLPLRDDKGQIIGLVGIGREITAQRRAEETLRHEKALMDALMDNIPDSIYFKDRQCRLVRINRQMMQSLKLDEMSQAIGKTDVDLYGEEFGRKALANDQHLMKSGEPIVAQVERRQLEDGQVNWTLTTKVPLRDDSGQIVGLVGITREINELMRVQEVLSQERNLLRTLIDNLPDEIYVKDRESRFLVCNAGVARMAGAGTPGELLEKTDFDILPQELAAEYYADEQRIMRSGQAIVDKEEMVINKAGTKVWFSTTKFPIRDSQGNIIGLVGMNRDVTERKHAEERLRLSDQILQRVNALVLVADAKGEVTYVSPSVKKILGYDPAEVLGDGWWNVSRDDEEERKREKDLAAQCARGEIPLSATPYEKIVKSRDGVPHYILWQDTKGPENFLIGVGHDITERKLLEDQLRQAQKLESLGTLAGGIAHDFNNVLGIILGYTSMLDERKADPKKSSRSIAAINKAVQRGASLVRQLLTFARKTETLFESVKLNDVIVELAGMLRETFPRTIQVSSQLDKDIPSITGDANQLHQALLNLSVNARDAMPRGGILTFTTRTVMGTEVRRRLAEARREQYVSISVADTGIGMDEPLLARVFEPFFTTKEKGQGTGLGLAVVYGVVASHQGFIDVESQVGQGTTFHLYFPIPERDIQVPLIATEQAQAQVAGGTETLLVVEDEEMMLDLLKNILAGKGYRVMTAKDGVEAVEVYTQHRNQIDLVLMDMGLPKLSGVEALRKLQGINPKVKVIFASGYIDPHIKSEVLKAGVKHFVQKPYIPQEVLRHIRKVIESDERL